MSAAAPIPFTSPRPASQPWTPSDRDRVIFQWVKFDGHKQSWVADQLDINQSSVSRIVERYERWIARGGPSQHGGLSHDERLRTQRWLTYERNEWILSSALRIAGEMERQLDVSKSTITHAASEPSKEIEVRTQHATTDRSGTAARFLRLAYRINMDQLKLIEQDPLPPLEPLSIDDLSEQHLPALADLPSGESAGCHGHPARADRANEACPPDDLSNSPSELPEAHEKTVPPPQVEALSVSASIDLAVTSIQLDPTASPMHRVHKAPSSNSNITHDAPINSEEIALAKKLTSHAYAVATNPPELADTPECAFVVETAFPAAGGPPIASDRRCTNDSLA